MGALDVPRDEGAVSVSDRRMYGDGRSFMYLPINRWWTLVITGYPVLLLQNAEEEVRSIRIGSANQRRVTISLGGVDGSWRAKHGIRQYNTADGNAIPYRQRAASGICK